MNTFELGNQRCVNVCECKGEKRVDLRGWDGKKPTKKGISLPLIRWKCLVDCLTLSQTTHFTLFQTQRVCRGQFQIC